MMAESANKVRRDNGLLRPLTFLVFCVVLCAAEIVPASAQVLHDPWVRSDRSVDCRSRQAILADIIKPGMTDEQKAVAIWRFLMDHTWHFSRADAGHPMHVLNVFGYSLCGTLSELQNYLRAGAFPASYISHGGCSRYGTTMAEREQICRGWLIDSWERLDGGQKKPGAGNLGHSMGDVFYDGHWHFLDCHGGFFVHTADGRRIAGYHDLGSDPTLVSDPVKTSEPFMPYDAGKPLFYYRFSGSGGSGTPDPNAAVKEDRPRGPEPSMAITLRPGEKYIRSWQPIPGAFKWSASWKGQWDKEYIDGGPRHVPSGPNTFRRYANGRFVYDLPVGRPAAARAGLALADNVAFAAADGKSPALHPADPNKPMTIAVELNSPYVLISTRLTGKLVVGEGGTASLSIAADRKQAEAWKTDKPGPANLDVTLDKELAYGFSCRLIFTFSGGGGIESLNVETIVQLNPLTLPRLRAGRNAITVTCPKPEELATGPLLVTYAWQEKAGQKTHTQKVAASPFSYHIEVGELEVTDPADPSYMRSVELALPVP